MIIEVKAKKDEFDVEAKHILHDVRELIAKDKIEVKTSKLYKMDGSFNDKDIKKISDELLCDPVIEKYSLLKKIKSVKGYSVVDVWLKHGVTDTVADTVISGIKTLGLKKNITVRTGHRFYFKNIGAKSKMIAETLLANQTINSYEIY